MKTRLHGADGRTRTARRRKELIQLFTAEVAAQRRVTARDQALIANAASLVVQSERLQAAVVRGDADLDHVVRVSNSLTRMMGALGIAATKSGATVPALAAYLRSKAAA